VTEVAVVAALVVCYAAVARRLDAWSVTPAIAFVAAGALLGPEGLDALPLSVDAETTKVLAEIALAVLLFGDATTVDPRGAERDAPLIARLLLIGLPLTILIGTVVGALVLVGLSWAEAALLGAILAPTDAALGMAVFTNRAVPARVRRVLNVESGLNDGIATPVVAFLIAVVVSETSSAGGGAVADAIREMGIGALAGVATGAVGALVLVLALRRGWASPTSLEIGVLGLAVLGYAGSVAAGGNGFVAAFVAGLTFRAVSRGALAERVGYTKTTGQVLTLLVWTAFGALFAAPALAHGVEARPIAYAVLSLTAVRGLSVAVALIGARLQWTTVAFMGWFGPRGLASVVFTLLLLIEVEAVDGVVPTDLVRAATWTILLSVVAHGLTAGVLGRRYGAAIRRLGPGLPESEGPEPAGRRRVPGQPGSAGVAP
jgi:NhaP-type Na+/H+ or K+/H+ antiporter